MSIIKSALIAASLVGVAASAQAQSRAALESGFHGNTPVQSYGAPRAGISQGARGAFAQSPAVRVRPQQQVRDQVQAQDTNPLFDDFHGN